MGVWSQNRASEFSVVQLLEVGFVGVVVVGLQVAKQRGNGIEAVIRDGHRLRVAEFHERLGVKAEILLRVVAFGSGDIGAMRQRVSSKEAHSGVVPAFREVVANLESVFAPAKFAG